MTTETKYVCEYCGSKYGTEDECRVCEEGHAIARTIDEARYSNGFKYPDTVCLGFSNDRQVIYKYLKPVVSK